jgi:hypothetical protein
MRTAAASPGRSETTGHPGGRDDPSTFHPGGDELNVTPEVIGFRF